MGYDHLHGMHQKRVAIVKGKVDEQGEIEVDLINLAIVIAIGSLSIYLLVSLAPIVWDWWLTAWKHCRLALDVRRWPFWIWTCLGGGVLVALLWWQSRYE